MARDVIIACDFGSKKETLKFLDKFPPGKPGFVKIGMELFYAEGPEIVHRIKERGHRIFLDLKLHDIPNTVKKTMAVIGALGLDMINIHAAGGIDMMRAGLEGLDSIRSVYPETSIDPGNAGDSDKTENPAKTGRPLVIAVTMLTSIDQDTLQSEIMIKEPMQDVVSGYALNARRAGLDGVVCSPLEAPKVHKLCGDDFITVTPGVRLEEAPGDDQKRVTTCLKAKELGADYIVVGRPITAALDPVAAYENFCEQFLRK